MDTEEGEGEGSGDVSSGLQLGVRRSGQGVATRLQNIAGCRYKAAWLWPGSRPAKIVGKTL